MLFKRLIAFIFPHDVLCIMLIRFYLSDISFSLHHIFVFAASGLTVFGTYGMVAYSEVGKWGRARVLKKN